MNKFITVGCFLIGIMMIPSCGGAKPVANAMTPPQQYEKEVQPTRKKRQQLKVDELAAAEGSNMRAVGMGTDYDEKEARREALRDAQSTLASRLEASVVALTTEYHKKTTLNTKKLSESNIEGTVEYQVAQKVSVRTIDVPEIFDLNDGSVQVYVCVELVKPTAQVLGEVYDDLSKEQVLGVDYDKEKFIKDNLERLNELREKVK